MEEQQQPVAYAAPVPQGYDRGPKPGRFSGRYLKNTYRYQE